MERIFDRLVLERHTILASEELLEELEQILLKKFSQLPEKVSDIVDKVRRVATVVTLTGPRVRVCRDPDDDHILQLCLNAGANYLVTGDKDLLVLQTYAGTTILSPAEMAEILET